MLKLENKPKNSKSKTRLPAKPDKSAKTKMTKPVKQQEFPRSYRLDAEVMDALEETLDRINEISPRKVSETRLVKALILFSREISDEQLMKSLKEVW